MAIDTRELPYIKGQVFEFRTVGSAVVVLEKTNTTFPKIQLHVIKLGSMSVDVHEIAWPVADKKAFKNYRFGLVGKVDAVAFEYEGEQVVRSIWAGSELDDPKEFVETKKTDSTSVPPIKLSTGCTRRYGLLAPDGVVALWKKGDMWHLSLYSNVEAD